MNGNYFYRELEAFDDFADIANPEHYVAAPDDWQVVIADVEGSTRAITEGRYKDVNLIGAASINAVLNVTERRQIPYVFGGDGATLLIPDSSVAASRRALLGLRQLAETNFDLSLRVGLVPVVEIHRQPQARVLVGKYRLSPGNELATFTGGGIDLAEHWIKSDPAYRVEQAGDEGPPDLDGLSCRWEPLRAQQGVMLSLLMRALGDDAHANARLYRGLIEEIDAIAGRLDAGCKPVCDANMHFRWPPRGLKAEIRATVGNRNRFRYAARLYFNSFVQWLLDRFDWSAGGYAGKRYRVELRSNTDYRRFDDTLRLLLDCSEAQATKIETTLAARAARGEIEYGLHRSDAALMTCLVFSLEASQHIHFVDGSDGGFTSAASRMKARRGTAAAATGGVNVD